MIDMVVKHINLGGIDLIVNTHGSCETRLPDSKTVCKKLKAYNLKLTAPPDNIELSVKIMFIKVIEKDAAAVYHAVYRNLSNAQFAKLKEIVKNFESHPEKLTAYVY